MFVNFAIFIYCTTFVFMFFTGTLEWINHVTVSGLFSCLVEAAQFDINRELLFCYFPWPVHWRHSTFTFIFSIFEHLLIIYWLGGNVCLWTSCTLVDNCTRFHFRHSSLQCFEWNVLWHVSNFIKVFFPVWTHTLLKLICANCHKICKRIHSNTAVSILIVALGSVLGCHCDCNNSTNSLHSTDHRKTNHSVVT